MHQTEIQKAVYRPLLGKAEGGILIPLTVGQRKADIFCSLSVSGILLERGGRGGGGGGGVGVWSWVREGGVVRGVPRPVWHPPDLWVCQNNPSLALTLADSASFLSVLKWDRGRTRQHQHRSWHQENQPRQSCHWESLAAYFQFCNHLSSTGAPARRGSTTIKICFQNQDQTPVMSHHHHQYV